MPIMRRDTIIRLTVSLAIVLFLWFALCTLLFGGILQGIVGGLMMLLVPQFAITILAAAVALTAVPAIIARMPTGRRHKAV